MVAAEQGHEECVSVLVSLGADVNTADKVRRGSWVHGFVGLVCRGCRQS